MFCWHQAPLKQTQLRSNLSALSRFVKHSFTKRPRWHSPTLIQLETTGPPGSCCQPGDGFVHKLGASKWEHGARVIKIWQHKGQLISCCWYYAFLLKIRLGRSSLIHLLCFCSGHLSSFGPPYLTGGHLHPENVQVRRTTHAFFSNPKLLLVTFFVRGKNAYKLKSFQTCSVNCLCLQTCTPRQCRRLWRSIKKRRWRCRCLQSGDRSWSKHPWMRTLHQVRNKLPKSKSCISSSHLHLPIHV